MQLLLLCIKPHTSPGLMTGVAVPGRAANNFGSAADNYRKGGGTGIVGQEKPIAESRILGLAGAGPILSTSRDPAPQPQYCIVQSAECIRQDWISQSAECRVHSVDFRVHSADCRVDSTECRVRCTSLHCTLPSSSLYNRSLESRLTARPHSPLFSPYLYCHLVNLHPPLSST